ncbi:MAG TPA: mechanosensitive ion channel domain-containing protein [Candidatus Saccharimonadales bacterium]|nr:mechanosensitive ion channel domain-containing protein [Candidatus Saccharimonadales bacterium]
MITVIQTISDTLCCFIFPLITKFFIVLVVAIVTYIFIKKVAPLVQDLCKRNELDAHSCLIINKIVRYILVILGATIALQNIGLEVYAIFMTAVGITGIILSYGLKDIVANFIAGVLIMGYKHVKLGDYIKVGFFEGKVIDMNLRYVTLESADLTVLVPNIAIYTTAVGIVQNNNCKNCGN